MSSDRPKHIELETLGNRAMKAKKFSEAIASYKEAVKVSPNEQDEAEFDHKIATCYRMINDFQNYFEYERLSAEHYRSLNDSTAIGQAADFLKEAGDILSTVSRRDLASLAYAKASEFFRHTSASESEVDFQLAWAAWASVCEAKSRSLSESKSIWLNAAVTFEEAANASEADLRDSRLSRGHQCHAMAKLASREYTAVVDELRKAGELRKGDKRLNTAVLASECLLTLHGLQAEENRNGERRKQITLKMKALARSIKSATPHGSEMIASILLHVPHISDLSDMTENAIAQLTRVVETFAL